MNNNYDIALYFAGAINAYYQVEQWSAPLQQLNKKHPLLFIVTDIEIYQQCQQNNVFDVIYLETFTELIEFYDAHNFCVILYLNNSLGNFQSLRHGRAYHVHLNHGESEKESMYSNQIKGYDFTFVAGQRAIQRYRQNLINCPNDVFTVIGRPQLDFIKTCPMIKEKARKTILYAPTWEATHASMDYCSVRKYGLKLVKMLLKSPYYTVIYKPHSAIGSKDEEIDQCHKKIKRLISNSQHAYFMGNESINDVFTLVDFAFFDNSSIMVDYLNTLKPAAYIEIRSEQKMNDLTDCFHTINEFNFKESLNIVKETLVNDQLLTQRKEVKKQYLGNFNQGESSQYFIKKITHLIERRNKEISTKVR